MHQFLGSYIWQNEEKTKTVYVDGHYNNDTGCFEYKALIFDDNAANTPERIEHTCLHSYRLFELYPGIKRRVDPSVKWPIQHEQEGGLEND